tara:strand:- start:794 stop:1039 length:246 start_codon:yes stop_codon:yes gene_type:complete
MPIMESALRKSYLTNKQDAVTASQAAKIYGCNRQRIYYLVKQGDLDPVLDEPLLLSRQQVEALSKKNEMLREKRMAKKWKA